MLIRQARLPIRQMLTVGLLPSPLKVAYYRSRGARIGRHVHIGMGSVVVAREIEIGEGAAIGFGSFVRARSVKIGRFARLGPTTFVEAETIDIGEDAKINEQVFIGGLSSPESRFRLGARTIIMQHTFINVARPVTIGDDTGIGGKCTIFTHGSWQNMLDGYPVAFAPVNIGSNVWIPWQVFIMPGVTIGDGATIGAGSLVTRDIAAGALAFGNPAKTILTADQHPARPSHDEQATMLRQMLSEFCDHLRHGAIQVERESHAAIERFTITDCVNQLHRLVVAYEAAATSSGLGSCNALLSLVRIPASDRRSLSAAGVLWLDLESKHRGGRSNPLGEELAEFVKRFGVRFQRQE